MSRKEIGVKREAIYKVFVLERFEENPDPNTKTVLKGIRYYTIVEQGGESQKDKLFDIYHTLMVAGKSAIIAADFCECPNFENTKGSDFMSDIVVLAKCMDGKPEALPLVKDSQKASDTVLHSFSSIDSSIREMGFSKQSTCVEWLNPDKGIIELNEFVWNDF